MTGNHILQKFLEYMAVPPPDLSNLNSPEKTLPASESPDKQSLIIESPLLALIEDWVHLGAALGIPRSIAQIYALIFISKKPVSAQDCVDSLKISRSSAGQGLKALRDVGAIRPAFELGVRREAFVIEPDLGLVIQGVAKGRIVPAFDTFFSRVETIEQNLDSAKDNFLLGRIQKLHRWRVKVSRIKRWLLR